MVCAEAGPSPPLQVTKGKEQPLDRYNYPLHLRTHRASEQKGWILLQALPPHGPVHLGFQGTRGREYWCCGSTAPYLPPDIPGAHQRGGQVLDGRPRAGPQMFLVAEAEPEPAEPGGGRGHYRL